LMASGAWAIRPAISLRVVILPFASMDGENECAPSTP
jgi:hypothetical protein